MAKALVLFSGGLDSRLVVKLLKEQGLEIEALYFRLPFGCGCCNSLECNFNFLQLEKVKLTIMDCTKGKLFKEYMNLIKKPKHGRGNAVNPCIDCKIFMFKKAGEYAKENNIPVIATGEVLGERPMSQTSKSLKLIDKEIGFEILRPLSAKLFPETQAEKNRLVDRSKLLSIQGRQRKIQFELAKKYNIKFPSPSGGCLLCEKTYASKLNDLLSRKKNPTPAEILSLDGFRHFRTSNGKIILGKNHQENLNLASINKKLKWNIIIPQEIPGPTAIFESKEDESLARKMVKVFSEKDLTKRKEFESIKI